MVCVTTIGIQGRLTALKERKPPITMEDSANQFLFFVLFFIECCRILWKKQDVISACQQITRRINICSAEGTTSASYLLRIAIKINAFYFYVHAVIFVSGKG